MVKNAFENYPFYKEASNNKILAKYKQVSKFLFEVIREIPRKPGLEEPVS